MKKFVYGVYDTASDLYVKTMYLNDDSKAVCAGYRAAARQGKIGHDTDDLEIRLLATWDNETGLYDCLDHPAFVCRLVDYANISDVFRPKGGETDVSKAVQTEGFAAD